MKSSNVLILKSLITILGETSHLLNEGSVESIENQTIDTSSMLMWFWEFLPSIFSIDDSTENSDNEDKKIFEFGMFANEIKLSFKMQEIQNDSIEPSLKKIIFKPLLELSLQEVYTNVVTCGSKKSNIKGGISYLEIKSMDDCCCGSKQKNLVCYSNHVTLW